MVYTTTTKTIYIKGLKGEEGVCEVYIGLHSLTLSRVSGFLVCFRHVDLM